MTGEVEWQNSVAVLPFADLSPQKDQEYFCDGLAETLINALSNIKDLRVVARSSAFAFKGKDMDIREVGKKLNVNTVLEGSIQKADKRVRITAQLINVADGYHIWSDRYDRELEDIFAIQDEIGLAIVENLKGKLLVREKEKLLKRHTDSPEAYSLYLKGLYFWNKRTAEGMKKGMESFQQAIENDPTYALAYSGLADSYSLLGFWCFLPPKDSFPKAKALAEKALEIDETLAEAHTSLAWIRFVYNWDWPSAESAFRKAVKLNPGYAMAHHWYGAYMSAMGRHDEGLKEMKRAQELDPLSLMINTNIGLIYYFQRHYDKAIEQSKKTIEMDRTFSQAHYQMAKAYGMKGMYKEAIAAARKAYDLGLPWGAAVLGWAYALSGNKDKAKELLHELEEVSRKRYVPLTNFSWLYLGSGNSDRFFEVYEKAYEARDPALPFFKASPECDAVRSDPRFTKLLKKMNLE
jgi:TolB-like protein/Tfp pilus assembly protein PilF